MPKKLYHSVQSQLCANQENIAFLNRGNFALPSPLKVKRIVFLLRDLLFPGYFELPAIHCPEYEKHLEKISDLLLQEIRLACSMQALEKDNLKVKSDDTYADIVLSYLEKLPRIQESLATDIEAIFEGDPAAKSQQEIILSYLSFQAIVIYRLAHELWKLEVPLIPRMMSELAHKQTGIDIHPGAQIGNYFCIDHGTGVVIGESTIIGDHVKVYQGVTLGALSLREGRGLENKKRHPTIESEVTLYANCTILGGDTVIGRASVIGGGAFVTKSIPPRMRVLVPSQNLSITEDN